MFYISKLKSVRRLKAMAEGSDWTAQAATGIITMLYSHKDLLDSEDDIESVVQDTMLRLWRGRDSFRGDCLLSTMAHTSAYNVLLNRLESRRRERAALRSMTEADDVEACPSVYLEVAQAVEHGIKESPEHAETILFRNYQGYEGEDTAKELGLKLGTHKSRLFRTRRNIGEHIGKDVDAEQAQRVFRQLMSNKKQESVCGTN